MTSATLNTFSRCRTLALAAMIDAGGKPCWVATRKAAPAAAAKAAPAPASLKAAPAGGPLSDAELKLLAACPPRLLASISRALEHLPAVPVPPIMTAAGTR